MTTQKQDEKAAIEAVEAAQKFMQLSRSIEVARLNADYNTESLLKRNQLNKYGKGGAVTIIKKIATTTAKKCIKHEINNDVKSSTEELIKGLKKIVNYFY